MTTKSKATNTEVNAATEVVIALAAEAGAMASGIDSIKDASERLGNLYRWNTQFPVNHDLNFK